MENTTGQGVWNKLNKLEAQFDINHPFTRVIDGMDKASKQTKSLFIAPTKELMGAADHSMVSKNKSIL